MTASTRGRAAAGVVAILAGGLFLGAWLLVVVTDVSGASPAEAVALVVRDVFGWSGLFVLALGAFLLVVGVRMLRGPEDATADDAATPRGHAARQPPGPVPVPPEESELEEGHVHACLRCGSTRVRMPSFSDGVVLGGGELLNWVCSRCHWRGAPMQFEHATAYRAFVKGLHEEKHARDASVEG